MTIDEFIWTSSIKLQSHDAHTYAFDEFIWSSPGELLKFIIVLCNNIFFRNFLTLHIPYQIYFFQWT